jgi:hypothetical protein
MQVNNRCRANPLLLKINDVHLQRGSFYRPKSLTRRAVWKTIVHSCGSSSSGVDRQRIRATGNLAEQKHMRQGQSRQVFRRVAHRIRDDFARALFPRTTT